MDKSFQKGSEGWEAVQYVGVSQNLQETLECHLKEHGSDQVAHIRALSFTFPQPNAMQDVAQQWRKQASEAGAEMKDAEKWANDALDYIFEDEDDDDDDDDMEMAADASSGDIISPFESKAKEAVKEVVGDEPLAFTAENVDKVLDEVRPYLIADGGNVGVERVDEEEKNVYLKLEGACGSCASSTVTMQMGIERVLKENFADLNQVLQVEDDPVGPTELTWEAVEDEVNRLRPAVIAMGGVCELVTVNPDGGLVELKYQGAAKVQQGLELAIRDVPFVEDVKFVE